jgi:hypothetical protein
MPSTPNYAFRYPVLGDDPDVPRDIKNLADDADAALLSVYTGLDTRLDTVEADLAARGVIAHSRPITNTDHTTTESFAYTVTVDMIQNHYYDFLAAAAFANLTGPSSATFRWRYQAGAAITVGTGVEEFKVSSEVTGGVRWAPSYVFGMLWTLASGQYTWGFSIQSAANTTRWYGDTRAKTFRIVDLGA